MTKIGANELCHCGSGKKYKKCCRDEDGGKGGRWTPSPEEAASIFQNVRRMRQEAEEAKYEAPPYREVDLGGQKIRFVGCMRCDAPARDVSDTAREVAPFCDRCVTEEMQAYEEAEEAFSTMSAVALPTFMLTAL